MPNVASHPAYQNCIIRKNFTLPFLKYKRLRTNVAKAWAKLEMAIKKKKKTFLHTLCAVKPCYETTCCGICLVSDANLHWAPEGEVQA